MDGIECSHSQDCSTSDLTDTENEGQESVVEDIGESRGVKRGYGTVVDCGEPTTSERTLRTHRMRDQFALLRTAVPNFCTTSKVTTLLTDTLRGQVPLSKMGQCLSNKE